MLASHTVVARTNTNGAGSSRHVVPSMSVPAVDLVSIVDHPAGTIASHVDVDGSSLLAFPATSVAAVVDFLGSVDAPIFMLVRGNADGSSRLLRPVQRHVVLLIGSSDTHVHVKTLRTCVPRTDLARAADLCDFTRLRSWSTIICGIDGEVNCIVVYESRKNEF